MLETLGDAGLPGLFALSFCAATLLPLGSEWLLALLILRGDDPALLVVVATVGNSAGAATTYYIGRWGSRWFMVHVLRSDPAENSRTAMYYHRYGYWSLLFSWVPFIGDPLCLTAGLLRSSPIPTLFLITLGKLGRYLCVAWLTLKATGTGP